MTSHFIKTDTFIGSGDNLEPTVIVVQPTFEKMSFGQEANEYERDAEALARILRKVFCDSTLRELAQVLGNTENVPPTPQKIKVNPRVERLLALMFKTKGYANTSARWRKYL